MTVARKRFAVRMEPVALLGGNTTLATPLVRLSAGMYMLHVVSCDEPHLMHSCTHDWWLQVLSCDFCFISCTELAVYETAV